MGKVLCFHVGVEPKIGGKPQNGWFISWKTLLKWMIWWYHYFWKHPCLLPGVFLRVHGSFFCGFLQGLQGLCSFWQLQKTESSKATKLKRWLLGVAKKSSYPNTIRYHEIIYSFKGQICRKKKESKHSKPFPKTKTP